MTVKAKTKTVKPTPKDEILADLTTICTEKFGDYEKYFSQSPEAYQYRRIVRGEYIPLVLDCMRAVLDRYDITPKPMDEKEATDDAGN